MISRQIAAVLLKSRAMAVANADSAVSDRELLRRFADERDEGAFTLLVWRHSALVWRVCHGILANEHDAEDVFQATFLVLARKAAASGWRESVANWLYETAYRLARKAKAAGRRQAARLGQLEGKLRAAECADDMTVREARGVLYEELAALPEVLRTPLVLCYLEGATWEQAARRLGWSQRTLARRLEKGKERLGKRLARRGMGLSLLLLTGGLTHSALTAGIPAALPAVTIQAALAFAVSGAAGAGVSAPAAVLANGLLRTTRWSLLAVVMAVAAAVTGSGLGFLVVKAAETRPEERPKPASQAEAAGRRTERVDRHGDPLPPDALARLGTMRLRHNWPVHSLVFTPDGRGLLTAGGDNLPRLWDVATGKMRREFTAILKPQSIDGTYLKVFGATLSTDGRILAARSGPAGSLSLLETATGKRLHEFRGAKSHSNNRPSLNCAFSPDSKAIAVQLDDNLELREVATGRPLWQRQEKDLLCLAFSPDGKTLASAGDSEGVHLWDARTGKPLRELGPRQRTCHIAFSPDGRTLAVCSKPIKDQEHYSVHLWDVAAGKEVRQLGQPGKSLAFPVFSPDGEIVAAWAEEGLCLWEATTGKELRRCQYTDQKSYRFWCPAAFSPDGKMLAVQDGPLVRFWDAASGKILPGRLPSGHESRVTSVGFTPDGRTLVSAAADGDIRLWDTHTGQSRLRLGCGKEYLQSQGTIQSPDGTIVAASCIEVPDGEAPPAERWKRARGRIHLWDAATGKELHRLACGNGWATQLALAPDNKTLAEVFYAADGQSRAVRLWDTAAGKRYEHTLNGLCPVFSPDGKLVVTIDGEMIRFWETATGKQVQCVPTSKSLWSLFLSPDGSTLATGNNFEIILFPLSWDKPAGVRVGTPRSIPHFPPRGVNTFVFPLAFSPDGRVLASSGTDHAIHLWETASGKERARFQGHSLTATGVSPGVVTSLSFSADGRRLASGSADSTILLWDVTGRMRGKRLGPAQLSAKVLEKLWADLAADDAGRAGRALWSLVASPEQTVPYLAERLRPSAADAKALAKVPQFLHDLDDDAFAVREKAKAELARLGAAAEPALRQALAQSPSAEVRKRLEELLAAVAAQKEYPSGDVLRGLRAVEVLEQIGTREARQVLKTLAAGASEPSLTREAHVALDRLQRADRRSSGQAAP